jgi:hypothetical protein
VIASVAPDFLQENGVVQPAHVSVIDTRLKRSPRYAKFPATKSQHLRHERELVECAIVIQRREYLRGGTNLDQITGHQRICSFVSVY